MSLGILGKKVGMTRVFDDQGVIRPVTVIAAGPCPVLRLRTPDVHGYSAAQIGFDVVAPERAKKLVKKPQQGEFQQLGTDAFRHLAEFRLDGDVPEVGQTLTVEMFAPGDLIQVRGRTKGRGFAGVQKRHGMKGGRATHGSGFHRAPGSIGQNTFPGRTFPRQKMPGQMGNVERTIQNLRVVRVIPEENLLLVEGGVPGSRGTILRIVKA